MLEPCDIAREFNYYHYCALPDEYANFFVVICDHFYVIQDFQLPDELL